MRLNSNKMFDSIDTLFDSGKDLTVDTAKSHEDRIKALKESVEKKRAAKLLEQQKASRREALRESYKTKIDSKLRDKSKLKDRSKLRDESKLKDRTKLADKDLKEEAASENKFYIIGINDFQKLLDSNGGAFEDGYLEITRDEANDLAQKQGFFASEVGFGTEGEGQELNEIGPLAAGLLGAAGGAIVGNLATTAMTKDDDVEEAAEACPKCKKAPCVCKECDTKNIKFREADVSHRRHK